MNLDPLSLPIALPEGVDYDEYLIATYLAVFPKEIPVRKLAPALAIEQSTGTWVPVPGETPEVKRKHIAKVIGVYEIPDYEFEIPKDVNNEKLYYSNCFSRSKYWRANTYASYNYCW